MQVTANEADASLRDIERTGERTRLGVGYRRASGFLIVWGVVWLLGYIAVGILPPARWGLVWLPLILLGTVASVVIGRQQGQHTTAGSQRDGGRSLAMALSITLFIAATDTLVGPTRPEALIAFPALVLALVYVLAGLLRAPRLAWIGAGVFVVAVAGWLAGPAVLPFALAVGGGGGLILGGFWLRQP